MSNTDSSADREPIERLAEEFVARYRNGEHPALSEYTARHPELAEQIKELFPALVLMEQFKPGDRTGSFNGEPLGPEGLPLEKLGDYRILREIGRGGMGVVYEAEQISLGRHVALKILTARARLEPRHLARFEREAKAAARLHHTNIVPVYGVGSDAGLHYYVMQYISGMGLDLVLAEMRKVHPRGPVPDPHVHSVEDVARALSSDKALSAAALPGQTEQNNRSDSGRAYWHSVARIGVQVAEALHYAHQQGILHRDIKPSNLLLDGQGSVWVTDFGLAKAQDSEDLTHTGDVVGTLRYLPPERFDGQGDARSDLYGLGLTLYELLAVRPAFDAVDRNQLIRQVTDADPPRLRKLLPNLPRDLETIVHKSISRDPNDRYANGQDMAADLRRFLEDRPIQARRISSLERFGRWCRRNPVVAGLAGGVAALLLIVTVVSILLAIKTTAARNTALKAEQDALKAQKDAEENAEEQRKLLGQQYVANGNRFLESNDYPGAALWYAEALRRDGNNPARAELHRMRVANTLRACPHPYQMFFHDGIITDARFSPDDRFVAATAGKTVRVWDAATGQELGEPMTHRYPVLSFTFSADGRRLTTLCTEVGPSIHFLDGKKFLRVWDAATAKPLTPERELVSDQRFGTYADLMDAAAERLLVQPDKKTVQLWDFRADRALTPPLQAPDLDGAIESTALRPDGRQAAVVVSSVAAPQPGDGKSLTISHLCLWDLDTGRLVTEPRTCDNNLRVTYSPDGSRLRLQPMFKPPDDSSVELRSADNGKTLWRIHLPRLSRVEFTPDGSRVLVVTSSISRPGSEDLEAPATTLLDGATGKPIPGVSLGRVHPVLFYFSPDSRTAFLVESDSAQFWRLRDMKPLGEPIHIDRNVAYRGRVAFSPDGRLAALHTSDNAVGLWDLQTGKQLGSPVRHAQIPVVAFSADGTRLLTAGGTFARTWSAAPSAQEPVVAERVMSLSIGFSPDGRRVVAHGTVYDLQSGAKMELKPPFMRVHQFSPDGRVVRGRNPLNPSLAPAGKEYCLWNAETGEVCGRMPDDRPIDQAHFSPDSRRLVLIRLDQEEVRLCDGRTGAALGPWCKLPPTNTPPGTWGRPFQGVDRFLPNEDGSRLFDRQTRSIVDTKTGWIVAPLELAAATTIQTVEFSPDGSRLFTRDNGGTLALWDTETGKPAGKALSNEAETADLEFLGIDNLSAFSSDSSRVVSFDVGSGQAGAARVWSAKDGVPLTPLLVHETKVRGARFSPDGQRVVTLCTDGSVRVWDVETARMLAPPILCGATRAEFRANGRFLVTITPLDPGSRGTGRRSSSLVSELRLWDAATSQPLSPPLRTANQPEGGFTSTGIRNDVPVDVEARRAALIHDDGCLEAFALTANGRDAGALRQAAEVLSGRYVNEALGLTALETDRLREAWQAIRREEPATWARPLPDPVVWHQRQLFGLRSSPSFGEVPLEVEEWHLNRLLAAAPKDTEALPQRMRCRANQGRWEEALADANAAIAAGSPVWYERGSIHFQLKQVERAVVDFTATPKDDWRHPEALAALALVRLQQGEVAAWRDACSQIKREQNWDFANRSGYSPSLMAVTVYPDAEADRPFLEMLAAELKAEAGAAGGFGSLSVGDKVNCALLLFRLGGRDDEVIELLDGVARNSPIVIAPGSVHREAASHFVAALAYQRLKQSDKAAAALAQGRKWLKTTDPPGPNMRLFSALDTWQTRLYAELLEREAAKAIEGK